MGGVNTEALAEVLGDANQREAPGLSGVLVVAVVVANQREAPGLCGVLVVVVVVVVVVCRLQSEKSRQDKERE